MLISVNFFYTLFVILVKIDGHETLFAVKIFIVLVATIFFWADQDGLSIIMATLWIHAES